MALNRRMIQVPAYINEDWSVVFDYFCENFEFTITETVSETEYKGYFNNLTDIPFTLRGNKTSDNYHYIEIYLTYNKDDALDTDLEINILDITFYNNMNSKNYAYISGEGFLFINPCDSTGIEYLSGGCFGFCITELLEKGTDNSLGKIIMVRFNYNAENYIKFNNLENIIYLASNQSSNGSISLGHICGLPAVDTTSYSILPYFNFSTTNLSILNTGARKLYQLSFADKWYFKNLYTIITSVSGGKINVPLNYYSTLKADEEVYVANPVAHTVFNNSSSATTTYLLIKIT
jgi:hypothetical protein